MGLGTRRFRLVKSYYIYLDYTLSVYKEPRKIKHVNIQISTP